MAGAFGTEYRNMWATANVISGNSQYAGPGLGDGFSWKSQDLEHSAQLARDGWEKARAAIRRVNTSWWCWMKITYPLIYGWLPLEGVLHTLRERPRDVHVVLTGRRCPEEIIQLADTVTEMQLVKHAFKAGVPAQRGIED